MTEEAIECSPLPSGRLTHELLADVRLGSDACVGDAMGPFALSVHANLPADALARSLKEAGAVAALVVDDVGRLVGLIDSADAAQLIEPVRAGELARRAIPVRESAPLAHAVDRMVRERARALPVVDDDGYVVALLTDLDALHWVARRCGSR